MEGEIVMEVDELVMEGILGLRCKREEVVLVEGKEEFVQLFLAYGGIL